MSTSLAEINVVPLVDVMLVLLIIFMVTAPMMQQGLQVNLPQARRAHAGDARSRSTSRVPADFGQTRSCSSTRTRCGSRSCTSGCGRRCSTRDDKSVFIRADGGVHVQDFATVMDKLKEAGVEKVGLMTKPVGAVATVHEAVSDILVERAREADGLAQMVVVSLFAHAVADRRARR